MTAFGHDPFDAVWESPNTGRTVYRPGVDDDYCEGCEGPVVYENGGYRCKCDDDVERGFYPADTENGPSPADAPLMVENPFAGADGKPHENFGSDCFYRADRDVRRAEHGGSVELCTIGGTTFYGSPDCLTVPS